MPFQGSHIMDKVGAHVTHSGVAFHAILRGLVLVTILAFFDFFMRGYQIPHSVINPTFGLIRAFACGATIRWTQLVL